MSTVPKTALAKPERLPDAAMDDHSVKVQVSESAGVIALSILFFLVFLAFLRAQRRERKLLRELVELYKQGNINP